jgi:hypothetical protein
VSQTLVKALLAEQKQGSDVQLLYGVATADNTVTIAGSTVSVALPAIEQVESGDYCAVLASGADRLILGPVNGAVAAEGAFTPNYSVSAAPTFSAVTFATSSFIGYPSSRFTGSEANGTITVSQGGLYHVSYTFSYGVNTSQANTYIHTYLNRNTTAILEVIDGADLPYGSMSGGRLLELAANDYVRVTASKTNSTTCLIRGGVLTVVRLR